MISFWVTQEGSFGIRAYCENRGRAIADRFQIHLYDQVGPVVQYSGSVQIFAALDRLTEQERAVAAAVWDGHARVAPTVPRLNDPRRALLRFDLLTALHERGINSYRVTRASRLAQVDRFPVFVRHMHDHDGPRSRLLYSRGEVARAICALLLRGFQLRDLMIVEFCDTSLGDGRFRKFSAFKVGDRIIPCHLMVSHNWCVKSTYNEATEPNVREDLSYVETNPHESWLKSVFSAAGIDYGRVDYGVLDGVPQVWEINLNPTLGRPSGWKRKATHNTAIQQVRDQARDTFHAQLTAAFLALDDGRPAPEVRVEMDTALLARVRREGVARQRRKKAWDAVTALYNRPRLGLPARAMSRLLPRK